MGTSVTYSGTSHTILTFLWRKMKINKPKYKPETGRGCITHLSFFQEKKSVEKNDQISDNNQYLVGACRKHFLVQSLQSVLFSHWQSSEIKWNVGKKRSIVSNRNEIYSYTPRSCQWPNNKPSSAWEYYSLMTSFRTIEEKTASPHSTTNTPPYYGAPCHHHLHSNLPSEHVI